MPERPHTVSGPNSPGVYTSRGQVDGEDWAGVARALNERMAARRIGQQELATRSGVSVSTLRQLQHGASRRVQNKTLAAISTALGWPDDHLTDVLLRGHRTAPAASGEVGDDVREALARIEGRLAELADRLTGIETHVRRQPPQQADPGDADR